MSIIRWYGAPVFVNPKGVTLNSNLPLGTENAVFSLSSSRKGIDQYAEAVSKVVQYNANHAYYQEHHGRWVWEILLYFLFTGKS